MRKVRNYGTNSCNFAYVRTCCWTHSLNQITAPAPSPGAMKAGVQYMEVPMTPVEIRAAHRIGAALLRQSKEKMRDQKQNLATAEA